MNLFWTRIPLCPLWPERVDLDGVAVPLRDSPLDPRMRRRLMRGLYETAERDLVKHFIQSGDQVLELGASIGIVTCFLARAAGPSGRVVSVEADANLKPHFECQLAANNLSAEWVQALGCPLWTSEVPSSLSEKSFVSSKDNLSGKVVETTRRDGGGRWLTAAAVCAQTGLEPTAVVVDIEGVEKTWVDHAPCFPPSVRLVIAEYHPQLTGAADAGRAIQAVVDEGFRVAGLRETVLAFARK